MSRKMAREPNTDAAMAASLARVVPSKISQVVALLRCGQGATLAELVGTTGWLPHTTRAALTGLKKKGHVIAKAKVDGVIRYTITEAAAQ